MLNTVNVLIVNALSFVICLVMLLNVNTGFEKKFKSNKVLVFLLCSNLALILAYSASVALNGNPGPLAGALLLCANYLLYLLIPLPCYLWILFVNYQLFHNRRNSRKLTTSYLLPYLIYALFLAANPFTHLLFRADGANMYTRGELFAVLPAVCYLYMLFSWMLLVKYGKKLNRRTVTPLFVYTVPAAVCGALQMLFGELPLLCAGFTVSLLILYVNIQNAHIYTDYLTGLFNRREADNCLQHKIRQKDLGSTFSAVMIDVDKFKEINDKYGHLVGDDALESVAGLLKRSLRADDFISRYGGDEFLVIFDISEPDILRKAIRRVRNAVADFNNKNAKPYSLSLSMGYAVYNRFSGWDADRFLKHIDELMYEDKIRRSEGQVSFLDQTMTV